jgi:hypothetical protein
MRKTTWAGLLGLLVVANMARGSISGTVTAEVGGAPLEGIVVTLYYLNGSTWEWAGGGSTFPDGGYYFWSTPAGLYAVQFYDPSEYYASEYYDNVPDFYGVTAFYVGGDYDNVTGIDAALAVAGASGLPEIDIIGGLYGIVITDGDPNPWDLAGTDFGEVSVAAGAKTNTFTIRNTGWGDLNLTGTPRVVISGSAAADFTVTLQPSSPVAASGQTAFEVAFDPSAGGFRWAEISIANDDADENPFNFAIRGTGTGDAAPEMDVRGNAKAIADGDSTPDETDGTDFGKPLVAGGTVVRAFTIWNAGPGNLILGGTPKVAVSGAHAADFTVTQQPASPVVPGGSTVFQMTFTPSAFGERVATVSVSNNDPDENPYGFAVRGVAPLEFRDFDKAVEGGAVLRWTSFAGKTYAVSLSTNLLRGFSVFQSGIPATPPMNTYTGLVSGVNATFWKVSTE